MSPFFVPRILSNLPASNVSIQFGLKGPCVSNNMACASSAHSILEGVRCVSRCFLTHSSIRYSECDAAFVGGTESCIGRLGYFGFGAMHALASHSNDHPLAGSCPFDKRRCGFVMGEGGVVLLLESYERAKARGASILISFLPCVLSFTPLRGGRRVHEHGRVPHYVAVSRRFRRCGVRVGVSHHG